MNIGAASVKFHSGKLSYQPDAQTLENLFWNLENQFKKPILNGGKSADSYFSSTAEKTGNFL